MFKYFSIFSNAFFVVYLLLLFCSFLPFVKKSAKASIVYGPIYLMMATVFLNLFPAYFSFEGISPLTQDFFFGGVFVLGVVSVTYMISVLVQLKQEEMKEASVFKSSVWLNESISYSARELGYCLMQYARNYVKTKQYKDIVVSNEIRDAVLVDSINYIGLKHGLDFAFYTSDLYWEEVETVESKTIESNLLLSIMIHFFYKYIGSNIPASVIRNRHMNELQQNQEVEEFDSVAILADFMNYIVTCSNIKGRGYSALRET